MNDIYLLNIIAILLPILASSLLLANNLLIAILLQTGFSLLSCLIYLLLSAPDVALTEAAINACLASIIFLLFLRMVSLKDNIAFGAKLKFILSVLLTSGLLIYLFRDFFPFGAADNNVNLHVVPYYLENIWQDLAVPNLVAGILASYRGYDTLGETFVIFTAAISVYAILADNKSQKAIIKTPVSMLEPNIYLLKLLGPIILIFAGYLYLYGEISPGGGFQAGAILASFTTIYTVLSNHQHYLNNRANLARLAGLGVFIYWFTGIISLLKGFNYLNYDALIKNYGQKLGIMLIELGVTITVWAGLSLISLSIYNYDQKSSQRRQIS